jgi:PAS domain S-box-containing protein
MKKFRFDARIIICVAGFALAIILVAVDELLDIPARIFNTLPTPVNWTELITETVFILVVGLLTTFLLREVNLRYRRAEELLHFERDRLATIFDCMEDAAYIVNTNHDIEYANRSAISQFGVLKGQKCYQYFHNEKEPCSWCKIEAVGKGKTVRRDLYLLRNQRTYDYIGTPLKNANGSISKLGILRDITERKQLEGNVTKLEELDKMKRNLLSTVSHELRSPLATIKGYASMLTDYGQKLSNRQKREFVLAIQQDADRLTDFVNDLLDLSRLEAGLIRLERRLYSVAKLLTHVVDAARVRTPRHKILLNVATGLPRINVDVARVEQVLNNLIDNATKYSAEEREIVVSARKVGDELLFGVSDQGIGIPAEDLEKVFDPMYRIRHKQAEASSGLGLGLSLCRGLVALHDGRIWAESEVGVGSNFWFTLPLEAGGLKSTGGTH